MIYAIHIRYDTDDVICEGHVFCDSLGTYYRRANVRTMIARKFREFGISLPLHYIRLHAVDKDHVHTGEPKLVMKDMEILGTEK